MKLTQNINLSNQNYNQKLNLNIKEKFKKVPFSLSRLKTAAQMYTRGNYFSSKSTA